MAGVELQPQDLLKAQRVAGALEEYEGDDFFRSVDAILRGEENFSAKGALIAAVFVGLDRLGLDRSKQMPLVQKGLEELGITFVTEQVTSGV